MKPGAVMVIVSFVPRGSFFFLNGFSRLSFPVFANVLLLYGQPFFCCPFFLVLHCTRTTEPFGSRVTESWSIFVYFLKPRKWFLMPASTCVSFAGPPGPGPGPGPGP